MMRRRKSRLLYLIISISSFSVLVTVKQIDWLPDQQSDSNGTSAGITVDNKNSCATNLLGLPSAVSELECTARGCEALSCDKLFAGDPAAIAAAQKYHTPCLPDDEVYQLASNCSRLQHVGSYHMTPVRASDAEFPIAFNVLIHVNVEQFERLLRAIYRPQNIYCVHADAKSPESFQLAVKAVVNCFPNVFLASRLNRVVYSGPSRLQADIDCMKDHLEQTVNWQYLINVAGQAYPLRTPEEMVDILRLYNGANDIEGISRKLYRDRYTAEWKEWFENGTSGIRKTGRRNPLPPHDIHIIRGSAYGIFSRKFVLFVMNDQRSKDLLEWSQKTLTPDEHYWATLHHISHNPHLHTPGGYAGDPEKKEFMAVYVKWSNARKNRAHCAGKYVRWICILGVGDLHDLLLRQEFFVNKFDLAFQPLAFECAERWLQHRVTCPPALDAKFYQRLSFVVDYNTRNKF